MGLLDDAKSSVSKWFEEQVAKNKAFKAAGGMGKSNPAMTRSMGLLPATGLLEQEGDAAARADTAYGALRKEYGPLGLRPGDFVPFASGGLAIDDARLAAAKGNYGQAAGSLAGVIPVAGAVGKVVRKITGGKSSGVIDSVKREISDGPAWSVGNADIDVSYRGSHSAPSAEFGAPLNDMTRGMYPDDFYSQNGLRYYGSGSDGEKEAFAIAQKVRGKPDAMVTAYRAVPKGAQSELNAGDWIATSKAYAKQHGESVLNGDYDIISQKVPAKHIYTNADSISEYGYDPTGLGLTGQSGLLNPEITKATNRGLYRTMLDDEEDKPSFPYGLIGK